MAEDGSLDHIEDRIARLERKVTRLERALSTREVDYKEEDKRESGNEFGETFEQKAEPEVIYEERLPDEEQESWFPEHYAVGENWLNWIGIGLLLLGVVFLFKYSIDQGWLIPPVRSAFGLAIGLGLLVAGLEMDPGRETFRNIMLGGGIAAFYITGFATYQLYSFATYPVVWLFMITVTLLAFSLSLQQNEPILSILGTAGALGTPFMLYSGEGSLTMLILYTCLVLAGSGAVYLFKGWKPLLWTTVIGGWLVLLVGWYDGVFEAINTTTADQWALQAGAFFGATVFWIVPTVREVLSCRNPGQWPDPSFVEKDRQVDEHVFFVANPNVQVLAVVTPVALLFYSFGIWSFSEEVWGAIALVGALLLGYAYLPLRKEGLKKLSLVHGFAALILITVALFLLLEGEILLIALAMEALVLRIISAKTEDAYISHSSHLLFGFVGIWLADRFMAANGSDLVLLHLDGLTELFILGIAGLAVPGYLRGKNAKVLYRILAHVGLLFWFWKELVVLDDGQAFVTVAWGVYALLVLFIGFWKNMVRLRIIGMATIFVVVAKLFLVDLTQIQTLLRILLFIGFGSLFLVVGYYLQKWWGKGTRETLPEMEEEMDDVEQ